MPSIDKTIDQARVDLGAATAPVFDPQAARERLAKAQGPVFWRSLEELSDSDGFRQWLRQQHPQLAETLRMDRRGFLKLLGASLALAGLAGCSRPPQTQIVPYVHGVPGQTAGLPRFFATALVQQGYAQGVLAESNMGRPTKIEGNPSHPASLGATDIFAQAAVLQLWDPDRSHAVMHRGVTSTWDAFDAALLTRRTRLQPDGAGLHILSGNITSPTLSAQLDALLKQFPRARWHMHEPAGVPTRSMYYRLDRAQIILSLDGDFLTDPAAGVRYARDFAARRKPDDPAHPMSRLYIAESTPSLTGSMADHRLPLSSRDIQSLAWRLARRLGVSGATALPALDTELNVEHWLDVAADDLKKHHGQSLVVVGTTQPAWMHDLGDTLNATLGNHGRTMVHIHNVARPPDGDGTLPALAAAMHAGSVDTLLVLDSNPVYDAPTDLDFNTALDRVPHLIHLGLYRDETARRAEWHLPMAHALESWGDARAFDGTASLIQPLIAPLYDGRTASELLARLRGDETHDAHALVRRQWRDKLPDEAHWNAALQSGVIPHTAASTHHPDASPPHMPADTADASNRDDALELLFRPDPTIGDGRWANNGWLQELPKPLTHLTWDNPALISPALAEQYRLANGDVVELHIDGRRLRLPVWIMPGQAPRSVTVHLGYGRRAAGHVGNGQGFDAYALRTSKHPWSMQGLKIEKTGEHYPLADTQHHFNMEGRNLLRVGTLDEYEYNPAFATADDKFPDPTPSLYPDRPFDKYSWGMSIDLNACIGCGACTIACQAENNIPVVGKDQVRRGREMHWIRVDRYFEGDPANPRNYPQPVPCMMCEHAPCEMVCPVDATVHDSEGLNVQVYNRCVGTRFCSNNCPYKVRRFNFLQYADKTTEALMAQRNPEVSVRRRGVMEKCTYCIQRIENAHITADREGRRIADGEVVTACQAVCGAKAISFGDQGDPDTKVSEAKASPRDYSMLKELGTRPHTTYMARVRNPHPDLEGRS
ncbi:MAG TPA: TAT-variant-translocated molybdopterin oxidoreductase [Oleiagrimonas sp.]|nr:TAT-variant-translocated molybdopterin oxidoreductase [Oleiagrimonas sp.]